ncbi:uncharacterized protein LOC126899782 [Daktulosphaira vitifoliae]|uniref:uncharacterized protein LOC126899782 n=1 Tax=Daktulosphaira vitifoliae TaxID=58002 RepID=UPI0021AAFAD6|nr:uncharacterized protein LOC126899782 [Daktulosphaira vitifoliae]
MSEKDKNVMRAMRHKIQNPGEVTKNVVNPKKAKINNKILSISGSQNVSKITQDSTSVKKKKTSLTKEGTLSTANYNKIKQNIILKTKIDKKIKKKSKPKAILQTSIEDKCVDLSKTKEKTKAISNGLKKKKKILNKKPKLEESIKKVSDNIER